jgi:uncharacterized protein (TIGR02145 family)
MRILMKYLNVLILLTIVLFSCDELEVVNPADPSFELVAPTLVSATPITDIQIDLVWENNETHAEEHIVQRMRNSTQYSNIATVTKDVLTYSDTSCELGSNYTYRILSKVEDNLSDNSNVITSFTSFPAPTGIIVTPLSEVSTHITWIDNSNFEDGYRIERDSGAGFVWVADSNANITEHTDNNLEYGMDYTYRVAGFTDNNMSDWTMSITSNTVLAAPTNLLTTAISNSQIDLSWTDNCNNEIGYRIEREYWDEPGGNHPGFVVVATVNANITSYLDSDASNAMQNIYRVAAFAEGDISEWVISSPILSKPSAPSNFVATVINDSEIQLNWVTTFNYYVDGFTVERNSGSGFVVIAEVEYDLGDNDITFIDSDLIINTAYIYRIATFGWDNVSEWTSSNWVGTSFPAPSQLLTTAVSSTEISLSWVDNCSFEIGYLIERDEGSGFVQVGEVGEDVNTFSDTGLVAGNSYTYRVRGYTLANNSDYSVPSSTTTFSCIDFDGNVYETVVIGDQEWMAENLKVTHYREGSVIPNLITDLNWTSTSSGAYSFYENNSNYGISYGVLYNWYAVTNAHNLAPEGWHIPTDTEWHNLITHLGGNSVAGGKLKEIGFDHWWSPNTDATNESGFTALPGGLRGWSSGSFISLAVSAYFWTATEDDSVYPWMYNLDYSNSEVGRNNTYRNNGASIRCVRD